MDIKIQYDIATVGKGKGNSILMVDVSSIMLYFIKFVRIFEMSRKFAY